VLKFGLLNVVWGRAEEEDEDGGVEKVRGAEEVVVERGGQTSFNFWIALISEDLEVKIAL
tara:strand:+ start:47 stop:226 length:180 start_codon:yes stop_codon:yes gene_type:complete